MRSLRDRVAELEAACGMAFDVTPRIQLTVLDDGLSGAPLVGYHGLGGQDVTRRGAESDAELLERAIRGSGSAAVVTLREIRGERVRDGK